MPIGCSARRRLGADIAARAAAIFNDDGLAPGFAQSLGQDPADDISRLREISELSAEGLSLEGIRRVLELEGEVKRLRGRLAEYHREKASTALVVWRPKRPR
jgi:hypothetical protein